MWQIVYKYPSTGQVAYSEHYNSRADAVKEIRRDFSGFADTLDFRIPIAVIRAII